MDNERNPDEWRYWDDLFCTIKTYWKTKGGQALERKMLTWGKIKKNTVQGFYERDIKKKDGYISTLDDISLCLIHALLIIYKFSTKQFTKFP